MISLPREAWAAVALLLALSMFGFLDLGAVIGSAVSWFVGAIGRFIGSLLPSPGDVIDYLNPFLIGTGGVV